MCNSLRVQSESDVKMRFREKPVYYPATRFDSSAYGKRDIFFSLFNQFNDDFRILKCTFVLKNRFFEAIFWLIVSENRNFFLIIFYSQAH